MNDALQSLIYEMEKPLSTKAEIFLREIDSQRPVYFDVQFILPKDPLFAERGSFHFNYGSSQSSARSTDLPWSPKLESELFKRRVKMQDSTQEALRNGTLLLSNLRFSDAQFGKDYTDHVFWGVIEDRFGKVDLVRSLLDQVSHLKPYRGESDERCTNYLKSCVDGIGNSLVVELGYDDHQAFPILIGAIAFVLDQRHSLTLIQTLFEQS